ncbi:MAG: NUDIX hydrolase [Deltaproteobacteria bacterium]|nr:NUDIX hydrolase [Deltaproteobacteria bacterium]
MINSPKLLPIYPNPWKTLSSKIIYSNPWMQIREDQVIRPDGNSGIYGLVEARTATGVVAVTEQNEIILVGQYRYPTERYSWEIIEGGSEKGESSLSAAQRELKEEAGIIAQNWLQLGGDVQLSNCFTNEIGHLFLACNLTFIESAPEGTEVLEVRKVTIDTCREMLQSGEIEDAMSIIGLYRYLDLVR